MATTNADKNPVTLAVIVEARIESWKVWGKCPWPNKSFPFGFEFSFESLILKKIDECEDKEDVGLVLLNPDDNNPYVVVRVDDADLLPSEAFDLHDDDEGSVRVPWNRCEKWLGVSHFKLMDILLEQNRAGIDEALSEVIIARDYDTITMTMTGGKYSEKRERAAQK